jgi:hypothetical protein
MPKTSSSGFEKYIRTISILVPHLNVIVNPFFKKLLVLVWVPILKIRHSSGPILANLDWN